MNKLLIVTLIFMTVSPAMAYAPPAIIQTHDMQMINEQRFRREVINDYNDVKQEKERFEKRNRTQKPVVDNYIIDKKPLELIDDNGEIKIKLEN